jgi:hypothetical protein
MRKINKFLNLLITSVLFGILFASCEKDISEISQLPDNETVIVSVLGKKLENPYSIENMQKALDNLLGNLKNSGDSITA